MGAFHLCPTLSLLISRVSRCRRFQLHRSRVGSLAELSSPPGTPVPDPAGTDTVPGYMLGGLHQVRLISDMNRRGNSKFVIFKPFCDPQILLLV